VPHDTHTRAQLLDLDDTTLATLAAPTGGHHGALLGLRIPGAVKVALGRIAASEGVSMSTVIRRALADYLSA
jgi:hypothetical protein